MIFSNETRINPELQTKDGIPIIHGQNYYIDEMGYASTYNISSLKVLDQQGQEVVVKTITPVTEFIYVINNKISYKTSQFIVMSDLPAIKEKYVGSFQGIAGFNETENTYQYINSNSTVVSNAKFTARINTSKQLEIKIGEVWTVPLGEFRCWINDTIYTINYNTKLPNTFGDEFEVTLVGFENVTISPDTNYINDIFVQGNTLYLSTRLNLIGSTPYKWGDIDTTTSTVIWSEDSRLVGSYIYGNPTAKYFFCVNFNTSNIYWVDAQDMTILQEYTHKQPILGVGTVDKYTLCLVDKDACTILQAYVSLQTWLIKIKLYFKFNQLSAYEDIVNNYIKEAIHYCTSLDSLVIQSQQRNPMLLHILGNKILSGCFTDFEIIGGDYESFLIKKGILYKYSKVEDSGDYDPIDEETGVSSYNSYIYIGSDLEPDNGGSTLKDTEIVFEGKINIIDGNTISTESSSDKPVAEDLPIRTDQNNPENWRYLYSKTLRYPVSYSDWTKISMMPTTKIFAIRLVQDINNNQENKSKK